MDQKIDNVLILVISKKKEFVFLLKSALKHSRKFSLIETDMLYDSIELVRKYNPDFILIDDNGDDKDNLDEFSKREFVMLVKTDRSLAKIPIIIVATSNTADLLSTKYDNMGVDGILKKPLDYLKLPSFFLNLLNKKAIDFISIKFAENDTDDLLKVLNKNKENLGEDYEYLVNTVGKIRSELDYLWEIRKEDVKKIFSIYGDSVDSANILKVLTKNIAVSNTISEIADKLFENGMSINFIESEIKEYFSSLEESGNKYIDYKKLVHEFYVVLKLFDMLYLVCSNSSSNYFRVKDVLSMVKDFFGVSFYRSRIKFILKESNSISYMSIYSNKLNRIVLILILYVVKLMNKRGKIIVELNYFIIDGNLQLKIKGIASKEYMKQNFISSFNRTFKYLKDRFSYFLKAPLNANISDRAIEVEITFNKEFYLE